jgi:cell division protein FtsB
MTAKRARSARRARLVFITCVALGVLVLATNFPVSELLSQRQELASASADLRQVSAADRALATEARGLEQASTVEELAHEEFGLVRAGAKAYDLLPPPGQEPGAGTGGSSLYSPPVVPDGLLPRSGFLGAAGSTPRSTASAAGGSAAGGSAAGGSGVSSSSGAHSVPARSGGRHGPGFWQRVLQELEFWR